MCADSPREIVRAQQKMAVGKLLYYWAYSPFEMRRIYFRPKCAPPTIWTVMGEGGSLLKPPTRQVLDKFRMFEVNMPVASQGNALFRPEVQVALHALHATLTHDDIGDMIRKFQRLDTVRECDSAPPPSAKVSAAKNTAEDAANNVPRAVFIPSLPPPNPAPDDQGSIIIVVDDDGAEIADGGTPPNSHKNPQTSENALVSDI